MKYNIIENMTDRDIYHLYEDKFNEFIADCCKNHWLGYYAQCVCSNGCGNTICSL